MAKHGLSKVFREWTSGNIPCSQGSMILLQSMCVYPHGREDKMNCFAPCKEGGGEHQDILGLWTLGRGFRIPSTDSTFLTSQSEFWIPVFSRILDSLSWIPDSKAKDSGSTRKNSSDSGILLTIHLGKPEIPVGKSNGSHHSEKMDCDFRRFNVSTLLTLSADLDKFCSGTVVLPPLQILYFCVCAQDFRPSGLYKWLSTPFMVRSVGSMQYV